jgi:hypothetical protein
MAHEQVVPQNERRRTHKPSKPNKPESYAFATPELTLLPLLLHRLPGWGGTLSQMCLKARFLHQPMRPSTPLSGR